MSKEIEIERKFVLSEIPHFVKYDISEKKIITQYYIEKDPEETFRVRAITYKNETSYIRTIKTNIKDSIAQYEDEIEISERMFNMYIDMSSKYITKIRTVVSLDNNVWEFDNFINIDLIMCELEMKAKSIEDVQEVEKKLLNIKLPDCIQEVLIKEVTGDIKYSNKNLAIKYEK